MKPELTAIQQRLLAEHQEEGCINVRALDPGVRISFDTENEQFELEVGTPKLGVVLLASDKRFFQREKAVVRGSIDLQERVLLPSIIGHGTCVVFHVQDVGVVRTRPILGATVRGKGDSYEYQMWRG